MSPSGGTDTSTTHDNPAWETPWIPTCPDHGITCPATHPASGNIRSYNQNPRASPSCHVSKSADRGRNSLVDVVFPGSRASRSSTTASLTVSYGASPTKSVRLAVPDATIRNASSKVVTMVMRPDRGNAATVPPRTNAIANAIGPNSRVGNWIFWRIGYASHTGTAQSNWLAYKRTATTLPNATGKMTGDESRVTAFCFKYRQVRKASPTTRTTDCTRLSRIGPVRIFEYAK